MLQNSLILSLIVLKLVFGNEVEQEFIDGNNLFATDVYKVGKPENNFLVSPFSAQTILALTGLGAQGATAQELRAGLRLPEEKKLKEQFTSLFPKLLLKQETYTLSTANKIYVGNGSAIREDFRKLAKGVFRSGVENIDFSQRAQAAKTINQWAEEQTNGTVRDLVTSGDLDPRTKLLLVNTLYFKAKWLVPFFEFETKKAKFHQSPNATKEVLMMREALTSYKFCENSELDAKFVELPFDYQQASVTFVLPNENHGLVALEKHIGKVLGPQNYSLELVDLAIPKFKVESTVDLKGILTQLGIRKAFTESEADFGRLSDQNLVISDARQKVFVDVNEEGVEAGAATSIRLVNYGGVEAPTRVFHADHPFIYYIKANGLVLFVGRVTSPEY